MAAVLADSSVYIDLLRAGTDPVRWLGERYEEVFTCGIVRIEVLRGVRVVRIRDRLARFFDLVSSVALTDSLCARAAEQAWTIDRGGRVLPLQDHLIAACAIAAGVPVLTTDRHFETVPGLTTVAPRY